MSSRIKSSTRECLLTTGKQVKELVDLFDKLAAFGFYNKAKPFLFVVAAASLMARRSLLPVLLLVMTIVQVSTGATTSNLEFYMHDNFNLAPNTVVRAAAPLNASTNFGVVVVIDDPLTEGPLLSSKLVGRGQGTYMFAALDGSSLLLTFTAVLDAGNDTLSFHGADPTGMASRDIAIIGGTGKYRMARGFATIVTTSNTINSTILHFTCTIQLP